MIIGLLIAAALTLAYANGSNDNFKAAATVYGSNTLSYRGSLRLATAAQVIGSLASVVLADTLIKAFSGKGLLPEAVISDPEFLLAVAVGAAATVLTATRLGIPVSTTHALIGALVGAGLALAPAEIAWSALGGKYFVPLLVSPALAVVAAALIYPIARWARGVAGIEPTTYVCLPEMDPQPVLVDPSGALFLAHTELPLTLVQRENCTRQYNGRVAGVSAQRIVDSAHVASAFSLGFARGLNDTPKILGLLVTAGWLGVAPQTSLLIVASAMAIGGLLHSRQIAKTLGHKITTMNHGQGLVANTVASVLVIGASLMGSPVSTTHVSTGAIFGIGAWTGTADRKVIGGILLAWLATLPLGATLAFGVAKFVGAV